MEILAFDQNGREIKPFGAIPSGSELVFRILLLSTNAPASFFLSISLEGGPNWRIPGRIDENRNYCDFPWKAEIIGLYFIHVEAGDGIGSGLVVSDTEQVTVYRDCFETPDWMKHGVMYQIFPDRFAKCKSYQAPPMTKNHRLRSDWGGTPDHGPDENGIVWNKDFFGGNLKGIEAELPYLQELGVTVIYLNPIFEAFSNHRYDTGNYKKIDPLLGTEADFRDLCQSAKQRGIRIILDGVFSHTGSDSVYFNKEGSYPEPGAYQSRNSPYYNWYTFQQYPDHYDCWWGIKTLPNVDELEPSYLDFILREEDSVVKHWLRCGASGFRLDVADELPDDFLDEMRIAVKSVDQDAVIIGEVWEDASNKISYGYRRRYLQGDQLDSVMNYPWKDAIIRYLTVDWDGVGLSKRIESIWKNYPDPAFRSLMNIVGTHDTARILTVLSGNPKNYELGRQRLFLALLLWAFLPGIPCIYYGDEIGMEGEQDPFNRRCFDPDHAKLEISQFYKRILQFRKNIPILGDLEFKPMAARGGYYAFARTLQGSGDRLIVAVNAGMSAEHLALNLSAGEKIADFVISGDVRFSSKNEFSLAGNSGIAVHLKVTPS